MSHLEVVYWLGTTLECPSRGTAMRNKCVEACSLMFPFYLFVAARVLPQSRAFCPSISFWKLQSKSKQIRSEPSVGTRFSLLFFSYFPRFFPRILIRLIETFLTQLREIVRLKYKTNTSDAIDHSRLLFLFFSTSESILKIPIEFSHSFRPFHFLIYHFFPTSINPYARV